MKNHRISPEIYYHFPMSNLNGHVLLFGKYMLAIITQGFSSSKIALMETSKSFLQRISVILILFFISTFVFGCAKNEQSEDVPKPTVIPTDIPTAPPAPDRVILSAAGNIDAARFSSAQVLIAELAAGSGLEFEVRQEIFANEITPDVKIIVYLEQPNNLGSLAAGAPGTQFVAIGNEFFQLL